ncbi:zinc ribbon domain-containing protein [Haloquadratum walsbyi]|jgi:hypothetical protein|uniref:Small CPxCG-related zinc finger protein n=1 Tax=Haloquadratum walsbyi (strain DSM 16790 / HBSQ001) TaxID=362976 RepID=Q18K72_HALWD|nr:zinc ribbon domain-containing protein [Haloquadratum walsbyi]CAJ51580.1 small CPxCG-related zinc finger protein [Haloquadratum walsbyi DSM 16790]
MAQRRPRRPWVVLLLGMLATGLGHIYLRRWARGIGWFAATIAVSALFIPPEAIQTIWSANSDISTFAPAIGVALASVADAYVLARNDQRSWDDPSTAGSLPDSDTGDGPPSCPNCSRDLDTDIDFCPWCTTKLPSDIETDANSNIE